MAAAVTTVGRYTGAATTQVGAAVSTGTPIKYTRDDSNTGTTVIPIPTTTLVTNFSFEAVLGLRVTAAGSPTTSITNRRLSLAATMTPTGYQLYMKSASDGTYVQGTQVAATATQIGTPPTGYAAITTGTALYDNTAVNSAVTVDTSGATANGAFIRTCVGVDQTAVVTGLQTLPNVVLSYDEQ